MRDHARGLVQIDRRHPQFAATLEDENELGAGMFVEAREPFARRTSVDFLFAHFSRPSEERRHMRCRVADPHLLPVEEEQDRNGDRSCLGRLAGRAEGSMASPRGAVSLDTARSSRAMNAPTIRMARRQAAATAHSSAEPKRARMASIVVS